MTLTQKVLSNESDSCFDAQRHKWSERIRNGSDSLPLHLSPPFPLGRRVDDLVTSSALIMSGEHSLSLGNWLPRFLTQGLPSVSIETFLNGARDVMVDFPTALDGMRSYWQQD